MSRPLEDVRILAIEQFGAGPFGTLQLADLGADVIKLEDPAAGGDVSRYVPPFQDGEDSLYFETFNRNKRSISLDLRHPEARAVLHRIVGQVDAVFSNLRGDQPARLGLTYAQLSHANPAIVCCSLSGFGMTGPLAGTGAYDYVIQGMAGWMSLTGEPGGPPQKTGVSLVDFASGYAAAIALLGGVWQARRDGVGCDCDVALLEVALSMLAYVGTWTASRDYVPARTAGSAHPSIVPFQNFATADGWIVVACPKERMWRDLVAALDRPDLLSDPRFATFADRDRHRDVLLPLLANLFAEQPTDHWLGILRAARVPCGAVNDVAEALTEPQVTARDGLVEVDHPTLGTVRHVASPLRVGAGGVPCERAPFRGEHTYDVVAELCGYDDEQIAALAATGVFGAAGAPSPSKERT
jgi:crotonobetainyl-CoA:carnitine CoA-transferase CaiB-like acyl-CoA transferase